MDKKVKKSPKSSSNTKNLIPVIIGLIAILAGLILMYQNMVELSNGTTEEIDMNAEIEHSEEYYEIMNLDFENEYPSNYLGVIDANNRIVMYQYGSEIQVQEAQDIIEKQRELFAEELIELNPMENQVAGYIEEAENFRKKDRYITSRNTVTSEMLAYEGNIASVTVDEQYSDGLGVQYNYTLILQDARWKIVSIERKVTTSVAEPDFNKSSQTETEAK